jgi:hypothetical protein
MKIESSNYLSKYYQNRQVYKIPDLFQVKRQYNETQERLYLYKSNFFALASKITQIQVKLGLILQIKLISLKLEIYTYLLKINY